MLSHVIACWLRRRRMRRHMRERPKTRTSSSISERLGTISPHPASRLGRLLVLTDNLGAGRAEANVEKIGGGQDALPVTPATKNDHGTLSWVRRPPPCSAEGADLDVHQ
jgi:hypothetical protein